MIDSQGRIVFDSSDDSGNSSDQNGLEATPPEEDENTAPEEDAPKEPEPADVEVDVSALGILFFPDLAILDGLEICPSLKTFELGNPSGAIDIPFLKAPEDWREDEDHHDNQENSFSTRTTPWDLMTMA